MDGLGGRRGGRLHSCGAAPSQMWAARTPLWRGTTHPAPPSTSWGTREPAFGAFPYLFIG